jgi:hypothetical protein
MRDIACADESGPRGKPQLPKISALLRAPELPLAATTPVHTIAARQKLKTHHTMFSHVVIFWTHPDKPNAAADLIAGAEQYLRPIPGVLSFHIGRMVPSHRPVVDQSYQVALNLVFPDKKAQDDYQVHPLHLEFVEKAFKPNCAKVVIYDFA